MREIKYRFWAPSLQSMSYSMTMQEIARNLADLGDTTIPLQYTGLKDRNGKEIYEGDILQDEKGIGEVLWVPEHCAFMTITREPSIFWRMESDGELKQTAVIGNIYENPGLLDA